MVAILRLWDVKQYCLERAQDDVVPTKPEKLKSIIAISISNWKWKWKMLFKLANESFSDVTELTQLPRFVPVWVHGTTRPSCF